ncbi:MAG: DUF952 domain-containing protein [Proteobacteria bacterium]|nr:MAG: DUF952 domain-containing protein [Pseudomonadota bacterium]
MIYHIAYPKDWSKANVVGAYSCASLTSEGFIHCSDSNQVVRVANFLFRGQTKLVLLEIDETKLEAKLKYEGETDELFPHVYGQIDLGAIIAVHAFEPEADGSFKLPTALSN